MLICEDNLELLADFAQLLGADARFYVLAAVSTGAQALTVLGTTKIDVLVVDLGLPDMSGLEVLRAMRRAQPACEMLVVTVFGDETSVIAALENGATGYVLKREVAFNLIRRIDELLAGGSPITPSIARLLLKRWAPVQKPAPTPIDMPQDELLSEREVQVLQLIAKGLSTQEAGDVLELSVNSVKTYIRRLYKKLAVNSRFEAVHEARAMGLLDRPAGAAQRVRPDA